MFQRLCHIKPGSGVGMVGLGSVLLHQKEFLMARALLQKGIIQKKKKRSDSLGTSPFGYWGAAGGLFRTKITLCRIMCSA